MNEQTIATDVNLNLKLPTGEEAEQLYRALHSEVWVELAEEEPERWDGMS